MSPRTRRSIATIGYEATTMRSFLDALVAGGVKLLVDVRAVASSRRPGFSKTKLAENLATVGIDYLHLRALGTPAEGRAAARAGRHEEMKRIFAGQLESDAAQEQLGTLVELVEAGRPLCLLCFEADPEHCHRKMVADALVSRLGVEVAHLRPQREEE